MLRNEAVDSLPCNRPGGTPHLPPGHYGYFIVSVGEAIELAANGTWQLADFQRSFVSADGWADRRASHINTSTDQPSRCRVTPLRRRHVSTRAAYPSAFCEIW